MSTWTVFVGITHVGSVVAGAGALGVTTRVIAAVASFAAHGSDGLDFFGGAVGEVAGIGVFSHDD